MFEAIVFDAYGTLLDVNAVAKACEQKYPGNGEIVSRVWRQKQLEYTWLRSMMNRYEDFDKINQDALSFTLLQLDKRCNTEDLQELTSQYLQLPAHRDVQEGLLQLQSFRRAILSNGAHASLQAAVQHADLAHQFETILSADAVKNYKPRPVVYQLAVDKLGLEREQILFVSSNGWDVAGAKSFGFSVAWIQRTAKPMDQLGFLPDYVCSNLVELANAIDQH